jgi:hypothetical protein
MCIMYNTKYECRYNLDNIFLDTDDLDDCEKQYVRDTLYREDLLNIFCVKEYNDEEINESIKYLYNKVRQNPDLKDCSLKLASKYLNDDFEIGLMILFSYDYMNLTHICISEFLENGKISEENITKLRSAVFQP